ncbi:ribonuclease P protein component [Candidatus Sneabacter namystus]|uniref:ribonuclease P protein component n=1 Tax=Candidatus Sneabacter namystus TaxID=2601646 RepID=UPI00155A130D|nr:ribonuclease P protein component [Candidatus Sneabacter namystus]
MSIKGFSSIRSRRHFCAILGYGSKVVSKSLVVRALFDQCAEEGVRFGIRVSRKVGGAVHRNLIRRRIRSIVVDALSSSYREGIYLISARPGAALCNFSRLKQDLKYSIKILFSKAQQ